MGIRHRYISQPTPFVAELTSVLGLRDRIEAWRALCARAIDPNPFYGPDFLLASAALRGKDIRCIAVFRDGSRDSEMIGLFPLMRARIFEGALVPAAEFFRNDFTCLTAPLVDRDDPQAVWSCFLDRVTHSPGIAKTLVSRLMPADGAGYAAFAAALPSGATPVEVWRKQRAALAAPQRFEDAYRAIAGHRRSDLRRRRRKLRADGVAELHTFRSGDARLPEMLDAFLALEAKGWKGAAGTAMDCHADTRAFARAVFGGADAELDVLMFNGQPIAIDCSLVSRGVISVVKTAYDEEFSTYAPGLLIGLHIMRRMSGATAYVAADSCAMENHVLEQLWKERASIVSVAFAANAGVPQVRVEQLARLMTSASRLKAWLKDMLRRS